MTLAGHTLRFPIPISRRRPAKANATENSYSVRESGELSEKERDRTIAKHDAVHVLRFTRKQYARTTYTHMFLCIHCVPAVTPNSQFLFLIFFPPVANTADRVCIYNYKTRVYTYHMNVLL